MSYPLPKRVVAEALGTAMLLTAVVGSGIMGERLAAGNIAIALLANTLTTGAALVALILTFGPISGGHFNPAVTLADAWQRGIAWREVPPYIFAQFAGAFVGVAAAHLMFGLPLFFASRHARSGSSQMFSELWQRSDCWQLFGAAFDFDHQPSRLPLPHTLRLRIGSLVRPPSPIRPSPSRDL